MVALFVLVTILFFVLIRCGRSARSTPQEALAPMPVKVPVADVPCSARVFSKPRTFLDRTPFLGQLPVSESMTFPEACRHDRRYSCCPGSIRDQERRAPLTISRKDEHSRFPPVSEGSSKSIRSFSGQTAALNSDPYVSGWACVIEPTGCERVRCSALPTVGIMASRRSDAIRNFIKESASRMTAVPCRWEYAA